MKLRTHIRTIVVITALCFVALGAYRTFIKPTPFDKAKWARSESSRGSMVWDYERRFGILNRTKEELVTNLGAPDRGSFTYGDFVSWNMGPDGQIFPIDSVFLIVELKNDRAVGWTIESNDLVYSDQQLRAKMRR